MPSPPPRPDRSDHPGAFYDALADDYHLIFLDCACGIGTQMLGLAEAVEGRFDVVVSADNALPAPAGGDPGLDLARWRALPP